MSPAGAGSADLLDRGGVDSGSARRAAGVGGEREAQHVDGLAGAPQQRTIAGAEPTQPVPSRLAEAAGPVVVERVVGAHLSVGVDLEAGLLDAAAGASIHARVPLTARDFPPFVVRVVIGTEVHIDREGDVPD